jgi:hypothetical protein
MTKVRHRLRSAALALALALPAHPGLAQDMTTQAFWDEIEQRNKDQQAEQARQNDEAARRTAADLADAQNSEPREPAYAPNTFVSFPPQAWADWVKHAQDTHQQELEERFGKDPAYQALLRGAWTYSASSPRGPLKTCAATFWTRNGGVSFVHLGGRGDFTLLGFFGATIPSVSTPRVVRLELTQGGETQTVEALNLNFGAVQSLGMVLFNVGAPDVLIGAIEDEQDFEIKLKGETIARGAWRSGLKARDEMASCLRSQGYLAGQ